jgi:uncharacterized membrane protein
MLLINNHVHIQKENRMNRDKVFIPTGMAMQAIIAGTLGILGLITLDAGQQLITSVLYTVVILVVLVVTNKPNMLIVGMAMQAFVAGMLANFGLITLVPAQQFITAALYLLIIIGMLAFRK